MKNEIVTKMSPEGLEIANAYLELGNLPSVCARLGVDENTVQEYLGKREVKQYIDQVYFCLLYTSPSPRDAIPSRMPSSA